MEGFESTGASETSASEWDEEDVRSLVSPTMSHSEMALSCDWAVYVDRVSQGGNDVMTKEDYMSSLKLVYKFRTMAEYQEKFTRFKVEALLSDPDTSLRVFQDSVSPTWEAAENKKGGKFVMSFAGDKQALQKALSLWGSLLAVMCTGRFRCAADALSGAVLSHKEWGTSIAMWNRDANNAKEISRLKRKLRKLFETTSVKYLTHQERSRRRASSGATPRVLTKKKSLVMESPLTVTKINRPEAAMLDLRIVLIVLAAFVAIGASLVLFSGGKQL